MALVTKENAKVGLKIYACYDDRPLDGCGINEGIITKILEDHYLYTETDIGLFDVWGEYDCNPDIDSIAVFTTKEEAIKWLRL